ncbi:PaaX family transcriptional regulator C-terminal domain-containing protein [Streptomyces sp. HPF1205]|uniref:PaaX family transcriptional regulator n=1 Tax=Streptomyces sp. HPF1205 TaxID=2873262 RepID=UPI001CED84C4|nr:PaaX family transcriptional regulator C-terminal domain-containing protein [Streptomyces sp. HPF1205]
MISGQALAVEAGTVPEPRTQSLLLTMFGVYLLDRPVAVATGSVIAALERVGASEEAVRSTVNRMVKRGLLVRHRRGRRTYFSLTPRASKVLTDGRDRVWRTGAVNRDWDGRWTMVGFSLPEAWRSERHDLRSRLIWAGFGPLLSGLWVAPAEVDVLAAVAGLGLEAHLRVFRARVAAPTEAREILEQAFDVPGIAARYAAFLHRWDRTEPLPAETSGDEFAAQLLLHTDWLNLVRQDPHLPAEHLPPDWPAARAQTVFRGLSRRWDRGAAAAAVRVLETLPL